MREPLNINKQLDWEEIGQLEADILRGEETDPQTIRKFFYDICLYSMAKKTTLRWPGRMGKDDQKADLAFACLYPWPMLKRVERMIDRCAHLYQNPTLLALDKAYIYFIQGRFDLSLRELNSPCLNGIQRSGWHTMLLSNTLFRLGKFKEVVFIYQYALRKCGDQFPGSENLQSLKSLQAIMDRVSRDQEIIPNEVPDLENKEDDREDPRGKMLQALSDLIVASTVDGKIKKGLQKDALITLAENAMQDCLFEPAQKYYAAALGLDPVDDETRMLTGAVQQMLTQYQTSMKTLAPIREEPFVSFGRILTGQMLLNDEKFDVAEQLFLQASKGPQDNFAAPFAILNMGYVREARGDFRTALSCYQSLLGGTMDHFASAAVKMLNTRAE